MKTMISEYGKTILYFLIIVSFVGIMYLTLDNIKPTITSDVNNHVGTNETISTKDKPKITVIKSTLLKKGITFNPLEYIKVLDSTKNDITQNTVVYGTVDTNNKGTYDIRYTIRDTYGLFSDKKITFIVD